MSVEMGRQNSEVFTQNGHGYSKRRRNALGNIFQDVDYDILYSKLVQELKINDSESEPSNQGNGEPNDGCNDTGNKFG